MDQDHIRKIAKLITDDPDIINEGWEELGIEDPDFKDDTPKLRLGEVLFNTSSDPKYYLIRPRHSSWALLPFGENVMDILSSRDFEEFSMRELLDHPGLKTSDVSVVYDPHEWSIEWIHGWEVDEDILLEMGILQAYQDSNPERNFRRVA